MPSPGPGHYTTLEATSKTGNYFVSKLHSSKCRRFGSEARGYLDAQVRLTLSPGPGMYTAPSDFGQYEAQKKYMSEFQRSEGKVNRGATAQPKDRSAIRITKKVASASLKSRSNSQPAIETVKQQPTT